MTVEECRRLSNKIVAVKTAVLFGGKYASIWAMFCLDRQFCVIVENNSPGYFSLYVTMYDVVMLTDNYQST